MRLVTRGAAALLTLWALGVSALAADTLKDAYAAILRGDYDAGRAALAEIIESGAGGARATSANEWLKSYGDVAKERDDLRQETFDWNVKHAQDAVAEDKLYLGLSFAAQASWYAEDEDSFKKLDWLVDLSRRGLGEANAYLKDQKWRKAARYYSLLERVAQRDEHVKDLRDLAIRHARLELVYETDEDIERRIEHVTMDLLDNSVALINENYYQEPDFASMAEGALDNLAALCTTTRLYDGPKASKYFDGVGNPASREHFLGQLEQMRQDVRTDANFTEKDLRRLARAVRKASEDSISLPDGLIIVEFMEGGLGKLDDFTSIVWPADSQDFDKMMIGEFCGVGIQLGIDEVTERLKAVTPLENSPALRAGIQPGDLIVAVNGEDTADWTSDDAVRRITGPEGTKVKLTMYRPRTNETLDFELSRGRIQLSTVQGISRLQSESGDRWDYMLDKAAGIAYVRLKGFNPESHTELERALREARSQGMKGLILDLRYNPGGLLDVAVETVSLFVQSGDVVSTNGRREPKTKLETVGSAAYADLPLVVLVNDGSASASEILAGALQDHKRAVVLGDRTFGKGSVQRVLSLQRRFPFGESKPAARLKLTTALYYLPSGRSPHKTSPDAETWGVDPDWFVKLTPKEVGKVIERENSAFIIHNENEDAAEVDESSRDTRLEELSVKHDDEDDGDDGDGRMLTLDEVKLLTDDPYKAADLDPQLEKALLHLRVKLAADLPWPLKLAQKMDDVKAQP